MAVQADGFFILMMYMHFLCLMAAKRALHLPLRPGRALLACLMASLYSLLALVPQWPLQSAVLTTASLLATGIVAFGSGGLRAGAVMGLAGLCYAGLCALFIRRGAGPFPALAACSVITLLPRKQKAVPSCHVHITFRGRSCRLPAIWDSGNTLRHTALGRTVLIAPEKRLSPLLPPGFHANAPSTLPPGFVLVPVNTINGHSLLMAFSPEAVILMPEGRAIDVLVAVCPQPLPHALLPCAIQPKEVSAQWKKGFLSGKRFPPSANG